MCSTSSASRTRSRSPGEQAMSGWASSRHTTRAARTASLARTRGFSRRQALPRVSSGSSNTPRPTSRRRWIDCSRWTRLGRCSSRTFPQPATRVKVTLQVEDGGIHGVVEDDGRGFVLAEREHLPGHLGLLALHERALLAGGWNKITSEPGLGTTVEFWLPFSETKV